VIRIQHATHDFKSRQTEIEQIYQLAFAGFPWYLQEPTEKVNKLFTDHVNKHGFEAMLAYAEDNSIAGALWYDVPSLSELEAERGEKLAEFASQFLLSHPGTVLVWEREIFVKPTYQGQKIASQLREQFLSLVKQEYPHGVLILTRMREDNIAIIHIAEKMGYLHTGIKTPSTKQDISHEFWYKIVYSRDSKNSFKA